MSHNLINYNRVPSYFKNRFSIHRLRGPSHDTVLCVRWLSAHHINGEIKSVCHWFKWDQTPSICFQSNSLHQSKLCHFSKFLDSLWKSECVFLKHWFLLKFSLFCFWFLLPREDAALSSDAKYSFSFLNDGPLGPPSVLFAWVST